MNSQRSLAPTPPSPCDSLPLLSLAVALTMMCSCAWFAVCSYQSRGVFHWITRGNAKKRCRCVIRKCTIFLSAAMFTFFVLMLRAGLPGVHPCVRQALQVSRGDEAVPCVPHESVRTSAHGRWLSMCYAVLRQGSTQHNTDCGPLVHVDAGTSCNGKRWKTLGLEMAPWLSRQRSRARWKVRCVFYSGKPGRAVGFVSLAAVVVHVVERGGEWCGCACV